MNGYRYEYKRCPERDTFCYYVGSVMKRKILTGTVGVLASLGLAATPAMAHNGEHPFVPGSQPQSSAVVDGKVALEAKIGALNGSESTGNASVMVADGKATVKLRTVSASKDMPHAQHIHIGGNNTCPPPSADTNGDGFISVAEGVPFYGGIAVSLTTSGDVSGASGLAVDRFPTGDGNFVVNYERTFDLPQGVTASDIANGVIVQHGVSEMFDDNYRYDGAKRSELDASLPFEATVPSGCGKLVPAGVPVWGLTAENTLVTFSSTSPELLLNEVTFKGLEPGEQLLGIDVRPATGKLYGLGSSNQLYVIDTKTGVATTSGAKLSPGVVGDAVGIDFNPTVDRLRITTNAGQNLRIDVDTGAVTVDGALKPAVNGPGARVVASAYTSNFMGATSTVLYDIDADSNSLVRQAPPNDGVLSVVGSLGYDVVDSAGFDISPSGTALAAVASGGPTQLRSIDLTTGKSSYIGEVGSYRYLKGIAISS